MFWWLEYGTEKGLLPQMRKARQVTASVRHPERMRGI